jgi:hypothetical protein
MSNRNEALPRPDSSPCSRSDSKAESETQVRCRICRRWFRAITYTHLRYKHGIEDPKTYKDQYALSKMVSAEVRKRIAKQKLLVDRHAVDYIRRKWGKASIKEITLYLGISASTIRTHALRMGLGLLVEKWDKTKIITSLRQAQRLRVPLSSGEARKGIGPLYKAAIHEFRSWRNALTEAGISYETITRREAFESWTDERILLEARRLHQEGRVRDYRFLQRHHSKLYSAARNHFGSWSEMLRVAGLSQAP